MTILQYGKKRKNIIRTIHSKVTDWLESIDDEELREKAARDVLVTGGCIASMYLGERVNDFDLYFKRKETVRDIAEYYVKKAIENKLLIRSEVTVYEDDNERIRIKIQSRGIAGNSPQLFDNDLAGLEMAEEDEDDDEQPRYRPLFISENAITLSHSVQIIFRFYGTAAEIHKNFDFIHATGCYDFSDGTKGELTISIEALESILSRTLSYRGSLYPVASIFRVKKFLNRGWRIGAGDLLKIMFQISELDMTKISVLEDQLTGVDVAYMFQLIEALKGVESEKLNSSYVAVILDKIFG